MACGRALERTISFLRPTAVRCQTRWTLSPRYTSPITAGHRASPGSTDITHLRRRRRRGGTPVALSEPRESSQLQRRKKREIREDTTSRVRAHSDPPMRNDQSWYIGIQYRCTRYQYRRGRSMLMSVLIWIIDWCWEASVGIRVLQALRNYIPLKREERESCFKKILNVMKLRIKQDSKIITIISTFCVWFLIPIFWIFSTKHFFFLSLLHYGKVIWDCYF